MKKGRFFGHYKNFLVYLANKSAYDDKDPWCIVYVKDSKRVLTKREIESGFDLADIKSAHEYIADRYHEAVIYRVRKMFINYRY
jgi:hypothetical protein